MVLAAAEFILAIALSSLTAISASFIKTLTPSFGLSKDIAAIAARILTASGISGEQYTAFNNSWAVST
jgi:hypothetical protein